MDKIDHKILHALQQDAKITNNALAEKVALSPSACLRRVQYLEQNGIIERYTIIVNGNAVDMGMQVMLTVTLKEQGKNRLEEFEYAVVKIPNVMSCNFMSGNYDYLIYLVVRDLHDYAELHRKSITTLPHVATLQSNFSMCEVLRRTEYNFIF